MNSEAPPVNSFLLVPIQRGPNCFHVESHGDFSLRDCEVTLNVLKRLESSHTSALDAVDVFGTTMTTQLLIANDGNDSSFAIFDRKLRPIGVPQTTVEPELIDSYCKHNLGLWAHSDGIAPELVTHLQTHYIRQSFRPLPHAVTKELV